MAARALVLVHLEAEGLGTLRPWLTEAGLDLDERRLAAGDAVPDALGPEHAALVVMGGAMGVDDADRLPWLRQEMALIRRTAEAGIPVLGVCLGAQLLAAATGGRVERGAAGPEVGAAEVSMTPESAEDALLGGLPDRAAVVQWHWDAVVQLPEHAVRLATSPTYPNQAFRVGARAWGLQFHVETTPGMVAAWAAKDAARLAAAGIDAAAAGRSAGALTTELAGTWRPLADRFAALAAG